jgi:hypothetical protein
MNQITKTNKIVAGLLSFAMVLTLVASSVVSASADTTTTTTTTTGSSMPYNFTRSLTVGSTGSDVTALQQLLSDNGFLSVAPTGYFGSLTKKALAAWQASVGISPASGYFGPLTRAYLAANATGSTGSTGGVSSVPGCSTGAMYSSTTGQPCSTGASSVPGCTTGAMYSSTTGQPCSSGTTTTANSGAEGTLNITQSALAVSNSNITTNTDVPVYGVQLRAQLGNVTVQRIDLDVQDTVNGTPSSTENPGNFINNIKVKDDAGNVLLNRNVSNADFVTGVNSQDYYIRLSGFSFPVAVGTTKNLVVTFSTNGAIDTSRTLTIQGYPTSGATTALQAVSGNNIVSYYSLSGITATQTFQKPGVSTLSIGTDASNPVAGTQYLDPTLGAQNATTLAFNALSSTGDSTITEVDVAVGWNSTAGGVAPNSVSLYNGSTLLASRAISNSSVGSTTVQFTNLTDVVHSGTTNVYTVKVNEPSTANGSTATTTVTYVYYNQANGSSNVKFPNVTGNVQTFYKASPNIQFVSASASVTNNSNTGSTTAVNGTMTIKVHPQPGQMVQPTANDFVACFATSLNSSSCKRASVTLTFSPNPSSSTAPLPANSDTTITLNAVANPGSLQNSGTGNVQYYFFLANASTTVNDVNGSPSSQLIGTTTLSNFYSPTTITLNY